MSEQVAIFTYGQPVDRSILKQRTATRIERLVISLFLFVFPLASPAYYLLYLMYFMLIMPAIGISITLAEKIKLVRAETIGTNRFRFARLCSHLIIPGLIVFAGVVNNHQPRVKDISIELPRKLSTIKELRIVFASDFHLDPVNDQVLDKFVAEANALHPDIVLIGGDLQDMGSDVNLNKLKTQFCRLRARYGVYAVRGNHDEIRAIHPDFFAASGIRLLEDSVEKIDNAFYLAGRQDVDLAVRKPIGDLLKTASDDLPIIVLDHQPTDLENVCRSRADLELSGHTHNGQLFPANLLIMPLQYELAHGVKVKRNTMFMVSSGVHFGFPPINTQGFSEILYIRVHFRPDIRTPKLLGAGQS
jgi:hypothetical protein